MVWNTHRQIQGRSLLLANLALVLSVFFCSLPFGVGGFFFNFVAEYLLNGGLLEADGTPGELPQGKHKVARFFFLYGQSFPSGYRMQD